MQLRPQPVLHKGFNPGIGPGGSARRRPPGDPGADPDDLIRICLA